MTTSPAVSNYVIARFGVKPSKITAEEVAKLRAMSNRASDGCRSSEHARRHAPSGVFVCGYVSRDVLSCRRADA